MLKPRSREAVLLALPPALALGLASFFHWKLLDENGMGTRTVVAAIATAGSLSGVLALLFLADALRLRRVFAHFRHGGGALGPGARRMEAREQETRVQLTRLQREVDRLSAVRDLALVANDDVDMERVLEKALLVIEGLVDAHDIRMFLRRESAPGSNEARSGLEAIAIRTKSETRIRKFGQDPLGITPRRAAKALATKRRLAELGRDNLSVATLLVADGEVIGALEVTIARKGRAEHWANEVEEDLDLLAKHVSLAIRKPALYDRAVSDGLTGLGTKRHFLEQARVLVAQAKRLGTPLSIVVCDIDFFKKVNDTYGHVAGDLVLCETAKRLRQTIRGYDMAFRYGGEELVVLAPNTKLEDTKALAERLRRSIAASPVAATGKEIPVTASFGVATYDPSMKDVAALVEAADQHLYVAKRNGRNQVQPPVAGAPAPGPRVGDEGEGHGHEDETKPVASASGLEPRPVVVEAKSIAPEVEPVAVEAQSIAVEIAPEAAAATPAPVSPSPPARARRVRKVALGETVEPVTASLPEPPVKVDW